MNYNNTKPISGESFFDSVPTEFYALDKEFVPLNQSIIWHCNYLFWKYFTLWEKTYHEHYEASLPSGVSESHKSKFIEYSTYKFIHFLEILEQDGVLPQNIMILEQGPGTGVYAKNFLDYLKQYSKEHKKNFYDKTTYIIQDTSKEILRTTKDNLHEHIRHVAEVVYSVDMLEPPAEIKNNILFVRHSNLWDQLPAQLLSFNENKISEIYVQAVIDKHQKELVHHISTLSLEKFITTNPLLWKDFIRSLTLRTKSKPLQPSAIKKLPYGDTLQELAKINKGTQEVIFSKGVLDNIIQLIHSIDWKRNGYAEIVDIVVPSLTGFMKDRRPKKYDGSIATVVNGPLIRTFLKTYNKHARISKIRALNHTVSIRNHDMKTLLENNEFITIGEIAARRDQPLTSFYEETNALFALGIDVVSFSDQAFVKPYYLTQKELITSGIFRKFPGHALMPILKTRNKSWEEINSLTQELKKQQVGNIFLVTGDPGLEKKVLHTSLDILPKVKEDFFTGAVIHPDITDIPRTIKKIQAGAQFFIMQATYNQEKWDIWAKKIKELKIDKQVSLIAALVPIVSKRTLSVLQFIDDMSVSTAILKRFDSLDTEALRTSGITLAQELLEQYKTSGIFKGIYIYSKSPEVICEVMGFPYHKTHKEVDSL